MQQPTTTKPAIKWILLGLVVLAVNNWLLIRYLNSGTQPQEQASVVSEESSLPQVNKRPGQAVLTQEDNSKLKSEKQDDTGIEQVEAFMRTERFIDAMDEYNQRSRERYREMEQEYSSMDVNELYDVYTEAETKRERTTAVQYLSQQEFADLEIDKIKSIYQDEELDRWTRSHALRALLQTSDAESLMWAKERLADTNTRGYEYSQLLNGVNERDPKYTQKIIADMDLSRMSAAEVRRLRYLHDGELHSIFIKNNISKILQSDRASDYLLAHNRMELELRRSEQERLVELMASEQKAKRSFAINLASNIQDVELLKEAYSKLERGQEKRNFVTFLKAFSQSDEQVELAKQLAQESDDPAMKRLFRE